MSALTTPKVRGLDEFLSHLEQNAPLCVICSPATSSQEHFYAVATYDSGEPVWFSASSLSGVSVTDDFDVAAHLLSFYNKFSRLYSEHGATNVSDIRDAYSIQASMGNQRTATTCAVHFLPIGLVVCFPTKIFIRTSSAVLLQRAACSGTRTFDTVVFYGEEGAEMHKEFRLMPKISLVDVQGWGTKGGAIVFCSPDIPIDPKLILNARHEGEEWIEIARALTGEDESSEEDSEWQETGSEWEECEDYMESDYESDAEITLEEVQQMLC